jgi:hypothetical protein
MKIILDNIKIEHIEYNKNSEILNWPNSFNLLKWESILSIYFKFLNYEYIKAVKDDEQYMFLVANIESDITLNKNKEIDPYGLIEKYIDYVVILDLTKLSKGPAHKKWMMNIINNEKLSDNTIFLDNNFILEKIENHKEYYKRFEYYKDIFNIKKSSKTIIKKGEFPFNGKFKLIKNNEYVNLNNSVDKPFFEKYKLLIYGDHLKVNGAGIIYNFMYFLKTKNVSNNDIHLCFTLNTNKIKFYIEIINDNAILLDDLIKSFFQLSEQNFLDYDIIETDNKKIDISNMIQIYNIVDCKNYTIYNDFS